MSYRLKITSILLVNIIATVAIYRYLISGGWLTNHYHLNDPNIINLIMAIFEPVAIVCLIAYLIWRKPFLYRLIVLVTCGQFLIGLGFVAFILLFVFTWHPKMM